MRLKIGDIISRIAMPALTRSLLRNLMPAGALDRELEISIDRAAERVRVTYAGKDVLNATFDEVNTYGQSDGRCQQDHTGSLFESVGVERKDAV